MDLTHYTFALFVFVLVCLTIWFFAKVVYGRKKNDKKEDYAKEQRLFKLYQNVEDMMTSFEEYIEETKAEFDQKSLEITQIMERMDSAVCTDDLVISGETEESAPQDKAPVTKSKPKMKTEDRIAGLMAEGLDKNEIAKMIGISSREVALIMEIKRQKDKKISKVADG